MVTLKLLVLSLVSLYAYALPSKTSLTDRTTPITRNTIFSDERLEGGIFENVDAFDNIELTRDGEISPYRLPTTTRPVRYTVLWSIDLEAVPKTHSGVVTIQLHATQANVSQIVIHSDELNITAATLTQGDNPVSFNLIEDTAYQFLRFTLIDGVLEYNPDNHVMYTLTIEFNGILRDNMYGIYLNWFRNSDNSTVRYMASTQFQATAARWAFPCYDEPSFKATFDVTIRHQSQFQSWFCTKISESNPVNGTDYVDDVYLTTPIMSTYLLALIVADYRSMTVNDTNGDLVYEVIARQSAIDDDQGVYAFEAGQALLAEMSRITAYDFYEQDPNLKMTQAAIPDFGAGAMENWGLLTYREAYLMYKPGDTNSNFKQLIAYILSHEIAHMWFGNLVTNEWWDVLWLNEGFARFYQYFLTNEVETEMGFETRFITEQVHTALLTDSANNPQPLNNPGVATNAAVSSMFSTISYNKGAAVIRMTEHLLGKEVHTAGLRTYLRDMAFKTALPIDLFQHLEQAGNTAGALNYADFSFIDYYKSWTDQPGHPVLDVQVNHQTGMMTIYQRRFNINDGYSTTTNSYIVPITFATASNPFFNNTKPTHIIHKSATVINRGSIGDEWVIFNIQQTGFYRVNYDDYTWDLIALALRGPNREQIHEYNRAQIVNDVFQFARSGLMSYSRALNILSFLENETAYAPWVAAITGFNWLRNRLAGSNTTVQLERIESLIVRWATPVMSTLTYYPIANETFMDSYLRWQMAPLMCNLRVQQCLDAAITQFNNLINPATNVPVPPDSRNWVYCNALRQDDSYSTNFEFLRDRFLEDEVYTEKILILQNIGCTRNETNLNWVMDTIVDDNYIIRPQDYTTAFNSVVSGNEENTIISLRFVQNYLERVANAFGSAATPLSYITARLRSDEQINEFLSWAQTNREELGTAFNSAVNGAESTRQGYYWVETIESDLVEYLDNPAVIVTSTAAPPTAAPAVSTTSQPALVQPVNPDLPSPPDSAASTFLAFAVIVLATIVNIIL